MGKLVKENTRLLKTLLMAWAPFKKQTPFLEEKKYFWEMLISESHMRQTFFQNLEKKKCNKMSLDFWLWIIAQLFTRLALSPWAESEQLKILVCSGKALCFINFKRKKFDYSVFKMQGRNINNSISSIWTHDRLSLLDLLQGVSKSYFPET